MKGDLERNNLQEIFFQHHSLYIILSELSTKNILLFFFRFSGKSSIQQFREGVGGGGERERVQFSRHSIFSETIHRLRQISIKRLFKKVYHSTIQKKNTHKILQIFEEFFHEKVVSCCKANNGNKIDCKDVDR